METVWIDKQGFLCVHWNGNVLERPFVKPTDDGKVEFFESSPIRIVRYTNELIEDGFECLGEL